METFGMWWTPRILPSTGVTWPLPGRSGSGSRCCDGCCRCSVTCKAPFPGMDVIRFSLLMGGTEPWQTRSNTAASSTTTLSTMVMLLQHAYVCCNEPRSVAFALHYTHRYHSYNVLRCNAKPVSTFMWHAALKNRKIGGNWNEIETETHPSRS